MPTGSHATLGTHFAHVHWQTVRPTRYRPHAPGRYDATQVYVGGRARVQPVVEWLSVGTEPERTLKSSNRDETETEYFCALTVMILNPQNVYKLV